MARIVVKYIRTESATVIQRWLYTTTHKNSPSPNTILRWNTQYLQEGNMEHIGGHGRLRVSDQTVEDIRLLFEKFSFKYNTGRVTLEHIPINDTANFLELLAIIPIPDTKTCMESRNRTNCD